MAKIAVLAIESSADETSAAVLHDGKLKSNIIYSQIAKHRKTGGIVPEVAAREHLPKIIPAIKLALAETKIELHDIDAIAVTVGPGLITSLMVGVDTAKALAFALGKPIIPINHLEGHLLSGFANSSQPPLWKRGGVPSLLQREGKGEFFPALGLIVSGGNTMLVLIKAIGRYQILGETLDDAAGEAFDKIAKLLGLPYPGGPQLSRLAEKGDSKKYDFPRALLHQKNYNFSFSGLKTAVLYFLRENSSQPPLWKRGGATLSFTKRGQGEFFADVAASVEQAIVDVLVAKTIKAAREYKVKAVLLGGGVAANKKLQKTLKKEIQNNLDSYFLIPDSALTTDNAGMIALAAWHHFRAGHMTTFDKVVADPNLELKSWR